MTSDIDEWLETVNNHEGHRERFVAYITASEISLVQARRRLEDSHPGDQPSQYGRRRLAQWEGSIRDSKRAFAEQTRCVAQLEASLRILREICLRMVLKIPVGDRHLPWELANHITGMVLGKNKYITPFEANETMGNGK